jgi:opacity protein-like surface antigen
LESEVKFAFKVLAVTGACMAVAAPAFAEGSWTSTVSGVYAGFGSRTWTDRNSDSASNYAQIYSCSRGATLAVYRDRQFPMPDEVVGSEKSTCNASVPYSRVAGDIHFTVRSTQGNGGLSGRVKVGY